MSILAIILLILLGLILLLIEFAVIPGVTIAGIGGFLLLGGAVYVAFATYGTLPGFITLAIVLVLAPALVFYFFKSHTGKKMILESNIYGKIEGINKEKIVVGDTGKTIGRLAPMGKARVNGEIVEAQSTGSFVDHNTEIRVLKIDFNKIIVEPLKK